MLLANIRNWNDRNTL